MQRKKEKISYRQALNEALIEEMRRDKNVIVYGLDVADHKKIFGSTLHLVEKFGKEKCFSTPLSEDAMSGVGLGAAINGLRPVNIHLRVDFLLLAMNQLVNMISAYRYNSDAKLKVPMVFRAIIGRGWGQGMQHSKTLHSFFAHIPGLKIIMPSTPAEAKGLLKSAIRDNNPVICIEHRWMYDIIDKVPADDNFIIPIGEPAVMRKGKDITILTVSWMVIEALKAAEILAKRGISLEIINLRTISPLNYKKVFNSVKKTGRCIVADYDWLNCGFSAEVAARVYENCFKNLKSPIERIGFAPTPCPTTRPLEDEFYPNAIDIIRATEKQLKLSKTDLSSEEFYGYENSFKGPF